MAAQSQREAGFRKKKKKRERERQRQRACSSPSDDRWSGAKTFRARVRSSRVRWSRAKNFRGVCDLRVGITWGWVFLQFCYTIYLFFGGGGDREEGRTRCQPVRKRRDPAAGSGRPASALPSGRGSLFRLCTSNADSQTNQNLRSHISSKR